jgi:hypothetical protein
MATVSGAVTVNAGSGAWDDIQGKTYPGFGRCIYCGSDGGAEGLRDEHIVPFSLGGNTIIEKASCRECEHLINPVDIHLGRGIFGQYRIHAGVQTRHPKDRPTSLPATYSVNDIERTVDLPIEDHPYSLAMPIWGDAGFFRSAPIDSPMPETLVHIYHHMPTGLRETLGVGEADDFKIWSTGKINADLFARGIAKIGYCHLVAHQGLGGFEDLALPDVILGRCPGAAYFVGGPLTIPPQPYAKGQRHAIQFADINGDPDHEKMIGPGLKLQLVNVRLFADSAHKEHGMPIYHVVAGAQKARRGCLLRPHVDTPRTIYL